VPRRVATAISGGEEFVVVMPRTGSEAAGLVAERIRATIRALGEPHPDSEPGW
jgi:PleD family two-component response regulator